MDRESFNHPFEPIVFKNTKTLILGSFPSIQSFENNFYYAHPRNQFWKILEATTGYPINNVDQRICLLKESKLGLWDMIKSCSRETSLDSSLEDEDVNDISDLLQKYPSVSRVAFTGRKSEALYRIHFDHLEIETLYLPSPSPAHAKMRLEQKIEIYKEVLGWV
ncbi:MAG: DNA-deoxyinosine glycosylase [Sulfurovum sp.]|nr:DNA-deoxyinosine glycosylase [Sulfurovum sp.]